MNFKTRGEQVGYYWCQTVDFLVELGKKANVEIPSEKIREGKFVEDPVSAVMGIMDLYGEGLRRKDLATVYSLLFEVLHRTTNGTPSSLSHDALALVNILQEDKDVNQKFWRYISILFLLLEE